MRASARPRRGLPRPTDPRVLVGIAITAGTLWISFRDLDFGALWRDISRANLWILILPSVPAYVASIWVRALRWRHLIAAVAPVESGPLFRATAVGFMVNNIFPLRAGEFVRAWYLSRECAVSGTALFGTVIVERVIDAVYVLALAALVLAFSNIRGLEPATVLTPLALVVAIPVAGILLLRGAPRRMVAWMHATVGRVLPERVAERIEESLLSLASGLRGLQGTRSVVAVFAYSTILWLVCSTIPFVAAVYSLGLDLGSPAELVRASITVLVFVGAAVALPSAPGFFGPYHAAARFALQPFGVEKEAAVALGTLAHAVFWVSLTGLGLFVIRRHPGDLDAVAHASAEAAEEMPTGQAAGPPGGAGPEATDSAPESPPASSSRRAPR